LLDPSTVPRRQLFREIEEARQRTTAFSFFIRTLRADTLRVTPPQLARIFAIYGAGFTAIFLVFRVLYQRVYVNERSSHSGRWTSSMSARQLARTWSALRLASWLRRLHCPLRLRTLCSPGSPISFMGPAHWFYGLTMGHRRQALVKE
jgi:hypothetical protein